MFKNSLEISNKTSHWYIRGEMIILKVMFCKNLFKRVVIFTKYLFFKENVLKKASFLFIGATIKGNKFFLAT